MDELFEGNSSGLALVETGGDFREEFEELIVGERVGVGFGYFFEEDVELGEVVGAFDDFGVDEEPAVVLVFEEVVVVPICKRGVVYKH